MNRINRQFDVELRITNVVVAQIECALATAAVSQYVADVELLSFIPISLVSIEIPLRLNKYHR